MRVSPSQECLPTLEPCLVLLRCDVVVWQRVECGVMPSWCGLIAELSVVWFDLIVVFRWRGLVRFC
ncbi:hypothetical protein E2C01_061973 [Portunus trituberculatus]|uniref:Uncharacterized protein n=1 Tax=Portunus trituberculatus TaxID=210409 RepID=A0A5B7HDA4_PORTR|nr:hypothetical protein [Portunus trituberculatus]